MDLLGNIGRLEINTAKSFIDTISFARKVIFRMFQPHTYNSAMRMVLVNQIYFTSVQILPVFLFVSIVLGSLLIGIAFQLLKQVGLTDFLGNVLMGLIVTELSSFFTVLFITLRSSSAINTEMAVMKVDGEINTLEIFRIDVINYLLIPRIITGIVSLVLLSSLFSIVLMFSGMLFSWTIFGISIDVYSNILLNSANFYDIVIPYCIQDNTIIYTRHGGAPCRDKFLSVTKKFNELINCAIRADQLQTTVRSFLFCNSGCRTWAGRDGR